MMELEFLAPYSLNECLNRLQSAKKYFDSERTTFSSTRIAIVQFSQDQWDFEIQRYKWLQFMGKIAGSLIAQDATSTIVDCETRPNYQHQAVLAFMFLGGIAASFVALVNFNAPALLFLSFWWVCLIFAYRQVANQRSKLTRLLENLMLNQEVQNYGEKS